LVSETKKARKGDSGGRRTDNWWAVGFDVLSEGSKGQANVHRIGRQDRKCQLICVSKGEHEGR